MSRGAQRYRRLKDARGYRSVMGEPRQEDLIQLLCPDTGWPAIDLTPRPERFFVMGEEALLGVVPRLLGRCILALRYCGGLNGAPGAGQGSARGNVADLPFGFSDLPRWRLLPWLQERQLSWAARHALGAQKEPLRTRQSRGVPPNGESAPRQSCPARDRFQPPASGGIEIQSTPGLGLPAKAA